MTEPGAVQEQPRRTPPPIVAAVPLVAAPSVGPVIYGAYGLRQAQDAALRPLLKRIRQQFQLRGVPVTPEQREAMVPYLWRPMSNARAGTYSASVRYLRGQGVMEVPPLRPYAQPAVEQLLKDTVERTLVAGDPITEDNRTDGVAIENARKAVSRAAARHAQQPARETVVAVADPPPRGVEQNNDPIGPVEGAERFKELLERSPGARWARMLTGVTSCAFCAMLASRGPVYRNYRGARGQREAKGDTTLADTHDGCDCVFVLVTDYSTWEGQQSHLALSDLWYEATPRTSTKEAVKAFRRVWDGKVRSGESGEYIAETMKPPGGA